MNVDGHACAGVNGLPNAVVIMVSTAATLPVLSVGPAELPKSEPGAATTAHGIDTAVIGGGWVAEWRCMSAAGVAVSGTVSATFCGNAAIAPGTLPDGKITVFVAASANPGASPAAVSVPVAS